jgi:hypothetical protein
MANVGARANDQKFGLLIDGQLVHPFDGTHLPRFCAFTPEGQHVYWLVMEPNSSKDAAPGSYQWVTYLDGQPVVRCVGNTTASEQIIEDFGRSSGGVIRLGQMPRSWSVGPDGVLTFLGIQEDSVVKFTVTPSADTSVATLLASKKAGGPVAKPAGAPGNKGTTTGATTAPAGSGTAAATGAANPAGAGTAANNKGNTGTQNHPATNSVVNEVNDAANKTKEAVGAFKHLFGK